MLGPLKRFHRLNGSGKLRVDGLCSLEAFHRALEKERFRSDRSDQRYSLLIFALASVNPASTGFQRAVRRILERIRLVDEIGWYAPERLGIILPYTHREGAEKLAEKICALLAPCMDAGAGVECEIFCYAPKTAVRAAKS